MKYLDFNLIYIIIYTVNIEEYDLQTVNISDLLLSNIFHLSERKFENDNGEYLPILQIWIL